MSVSFRIDVTDVPSSFPILEWLEENLSPYKTRYESYNCYSYWGKSWQLHDWKSSSKLPAYYFIIVPTEEIKIRLLLEIL